MLITCLLLVTHIVWPARSRVAFATKSGGWGGLVTIKSEREQGGKGIKRLKLGTPLTVRVCRSS